MINKLTFEKTKALANKIPLICSLNLYNENIIDIKCEDLIVVFVFLKHNIKNQFNLLSNISGVDLLQNTYRYSVVYELLSLTHNRRLRVRTSINEVNTVNTLTYIFINADWWEKETWDMFGIYFLGHKNLRRLLTDYGFESHPLRKDFPLIGFEEVYYDLSTKKVELTVVNLFQDIKIFGKETNIANYIH